MNPIRHSTLRWMQKSPAHFYAAWNGERVGSFRGSPKGSAVHSLVLGGAPVVLYPKRRYGKEWDAFEAEHAGAWILSKDEYEKANRMADAVKGHREAYEILCGAGQALEVTRNWVIDGMACTGTPDSASPDRIGDLKTCDSAELDVFRRKALKLCYHSQDNYYAHSFERPAPDQYIVAVEAHAPHPVVIFQLSESDKLAAERLWRDWLEKVRECMAANHWPGYATGIVPLDVPTNDVALNWDEEEAA